MHVRSCPGLAGPLPGLADAHAHPAVGAGPAGLVALDASAARANLTAWAQAGITLVRDVGSPRGLTLELRPGRACRRCRQPAGAWPRRAAISRTCSMRRPLAVRLGVPVLAGTNLTGSIPREVALLAQMGLEPKDALAAASTWPRRFLGAPATADIVTYHHDPREDPGQLAHPAAVVAGRIRLR